MNELTSEEIEKKWIRYLKRSDTFIYVATEPNNSICGFAASQFEPDKPGTGLLYSLHTSANSRGKGIGKKLIAAAANHFIQNGITTMILWVMKGNDEALSIYKHLGAEIYTYDTHQFDWVSVPEIGLIWRDINSLCVL